MRFTLLALLCAGTAAFCQTPSPSGVDPGKLFNMPQKFMLRAPGFTPPPASLKTLTLRPPYSTVITPGPATPRPKLNNPQIDPKIIIHPPWPSRGDQTKGRDVSRNQFPDLRYLPIRVGAAKIASHDGASPISGRPPR